MLVNQISYETYFNFRKIISENHEIFKEMLKTQTEDQTNDFIANQKNFTASQFKPDEIIKYCWHMQCPGYISQYGDEIKQKIKSPAYRKSHGEEIYQFFIDLIKDKRPCAFKNQTNIKYFLQINKDIGGFVDDIQKSLRNTKYNDVIFRYHLDDILHTNAQKYSIDKFAKLSPYWQIQRYMQNNCYLPTGNILQKQIQKRLNLKDQECFDCHKTCKKLQVHHVSTNHSNGSFSNMVLICPTCHTIRHNMLEKSI